MKRGTSGLSFIVGVDKPVGMSSHDVVNRCRKIFGEKRVGHTGTLDPAASGVLTVCVGPATRLDAYLESDTKSYEARIVFGAATDTDDAQGTVVRTAQVPDALGTRAEAGRVLAGIVGVQAQMPPAYSAIKVGGVKGYEAARRGAAIELKPRQIEVLAAALQEVGRTDQGCLYWDVRLTVSKGTYIRSIARDIGARQGTAAHLGALRRTRSGRVDLDACVTLEQLEADPGLGRLDPVRLLGYRVLFAGPALERALANGGPLPVPSEGDSAVGGVTLFRAEGASGAQRGAGCPCVAQVVPDARPPAPGEVISVVSDNKLVALYSFDERRGQLRARCVFAQGVSRGSDI